MRERERERAAAIDFLVREIAAVAAAAAAAAVAEIVNCESDRVSAH